MRGDCRPIVRHHSVRCECVRAHVRSGYARVRMGALSRFLHACLRARTRMIPSHSHARFYPPWRFSTVIIIGAGQRNPSPSEDYINREISWKLRSNVFGGRLNQPTQQRSASQARALQQTTPAHGIPTRSVPRRLCVARVPRCVCRCTCALVRSVRPDFHLLCRHCTALRMVLAVGSMLLRLCLRRQRSA